MLRGGLRPGETFALKLGDILWHRSAIRVQRNISAGRITTPKSGKPRIVYVTPELMRELRAHCEARFGRVVPLDSDERKEKLATEPRRLAVSKQGGPTPRP